MELRSATQNASSSHSNAINPRSSSMQTLPSPGTSSIRRISHQLAESTTSSFGSRGRRIQQLPESLARSTSSRGRRNQQQPEETTNSISSRGRRVQQPPEGTASRISSIGRRNQQQPERAAISTNSRGRRNQQQPEDTASRTSSTGGRDQQQAEETASRMSSRGRRNQQRPENADSSASSRGRRNQQQPQDTASSCSSIGMRNQQQPESAASSINSRERRNQQQPEDTASSSSSIERRNQQQPERAASIINSRGRRNQQQWEVMASRISSTGRRNQHQAEETPSRMSSRGRRNQQQPEDTVSRTNTRGRTENQRIIDYSSNLSAIYESEASDETNRLYAEDSLNMPEASDSTDSDNLYRIDSTGISLQLHSRRSWWSQVVQLLRICSALSFIALLVFPSPQSELFGTQIAFNLETGTFLLLSTVFQIVFFLFNMYNLISGVFSLFSNQSNLDFVQQLRFFKFTYEDSMFIFVVTFIFRISTELKYHVVALDNDDQNAVKDNFPGSTIARDYNYLLIMQALLIWINKVLPVAYESLEEFVLHSVLNDVLFILVIYGISGYQASCDGDDSIICSVNPFRIFHILHILLPVVYVMLLYILIKRFRFRAISLSDNEITQDWDLEVYFHSLSRFDKFITLFFIILPFLLLLDWNYLSTSRGMFQLNQDYMNYQVERAKYEFDFIQTTENVTMNKLSEGNQWLTFLRNLTNEMPISHVLQDPTPQKRKYWINRYNQSLKVLIEHLEALNIWDLIFDTQKQAERISEWIRELRELKTALEGLLFVP